MTLFTFKNSYFLCNKSKFNKKILYFDHKKSNFHFGPMYNLHWSQKFSSIFSFFIEALPTKLLKRTHV
jgi:hypothetical protein